MTTDMITDTAPESGKPENGNAVLPSSNLSKTLIWMTILIVIGAIGIAALAVASALASNDNDSSAAWAVVTAVVAGILGLLANNPTS